MFVEPTYNGLVRARPPFVSYLAEDDDWWGTQEWLVRGKFCAPNYRNDVQPTARVGEIVQTVQAGMPGVDAQLGVARFHSLGDCHVVVPIGADPKYAADPEFLHYASAAAVVKEWRWLADVSFKSGHSGVLAGVDAAGDLVAIVSPVALNSAHLVGEA